MKVSELAALVNRFKLEMQTVADPEWIALNRKSATSFEQGNYREAATAAKSALRAAEQALGADHPGVATSLNNLGMLCYAQEQFEKAEPLHQRALGIREKALGSNHPDVAKASTTWG